MFLFFFLLLSPPFFFEKGVKLLFAGVVHPLTMAMVLCGAYHGDLQHEVVPLEEVLPSPYYVRETVAGTPGAS